MKKSYLIVTCVALVAALVAGSYRTDELREGMSLGTPSIQSASALAFGPDGILLIGDSKSATIFAVDTKDKQPQEKATKVEIKNIDQKIASLLGTETKNISITDVAVNPVSRKVYLSVQTGDGSPVIFRFEGDQLTAVDLKNVLHSSVSLTSAPAEDAKDDRGRALRPQSISDLGYYEGKVMVSGLSNQEFKSSFRSISFPFNDKQEMSSLEIYHAAHAQYETFAPIRTFTTAELGGKKYLVASYTCTPLVLFPLDELKPGTHVKGRTVAEKGSGNSPLDMIVMRKGGESFLLMANSSRPVFKVKFKDIESFAGSLTTPVEENFATAGVGFVSIPAVNVLQLDRLDDTQMVVLQRRSNGDLDLWTATDRWL